MTVCLSIRRGGTTAVVLAALLSAPGAHAEWNRLLPFWGQPYPAGFARTDAPEPAMNAGCPQGRGLRRAVPAAGRRDCPVSLHARD